jgi:hypothetical protein
VWRSPAGESPACLERGSSDNHARSVAGGVLQVTESRLSDATRRLATAEEKVTALKGERSRLYQQLAASSDASRTQVRYGCFTIGQSARRVLQAFSPTGRPKGGHLCYP